MIAALTPAVDAFADDAGHGRRGGDDHRQVHLGGHSRDCRVGLDAQHTRPLGVYGEDRTAERAAHQVPEEVRPTLPGLGRADHCHVLREKNALKGRCRWRKDVVCRPGADGFGCVIKRSLSEGVGPADRDASQLRRRFYRKQLKPAEPSEPASRSTIPIRRDRAGLCVQSGQDAGARDRRALLGVWIRRRMRHGRRSH